MQPAAGETDGTYERPADPGCEPRERREAVRAETEARDKAPAGPPQPWIGIELRYLFALAAIAHEGSFRGAAESLDYVQSAVSQQLSRLESAVGARLVERARGHSTVKLTEAGELLLEHFETIRARLAWAQSDIQALKTGGRERLSVGVYESVAAKLMPPILIALREQMPGLTIDMKRALGDDELARRVAFGELDLAFGERPQPSETFGYQELMPDRYTLLVQPESMLAERLAPLEPEELAALPAILVTGDRDATAVYEGFRSAGIRADNVIEAAYDSAVRGFVAAGLGAGILPRLSIDEDDPRTTAIPLQDFIAPRRITLFWHRDRHHSRSREAFVEAASVVSTMPSADHNFRRPVPAIHQ
jgi:DNA-binding transcriptional LysR family regulator